jgi:hypothetical protein
MRRVNIDLVVAKKDTPDTPAFGPGVDTFGPGADAYSPGADAPGYGMPPLRGSPRGRRLGKNLPVLVGTSYPQPAPKGRYSIVPGASAPGTFFTPNRTTRSGFLARDLKLPAGRGSGHVPPGTTRRAPGSPRCGGHRPGRPCSNHVTEDGGERPLRPHVAPVVPLASTFPR